MCKYEHDLWDSVYTSLYMRDNMQLHRVIAACTIHLDYLVMDRWNFGQN